MALTSTPPSLRWAVKESFIRYVTTSGGRVSCGNGARWVDGEFDFAPDESESDDGSRAFLGDVLFVAHGSLLRVALGLPRVDVTAAPALVTALTDPSDPDSRVVIAQASPQPGTADLEGRSRWTTTLTGGGAAVFGGNYAEGTELSAIRF